MTPEELKEMKEKAALWDWLEPRVSKVVLSHGRYRRVFNDDGEEPFREWITYVSQPTITVNGVEVPAPLTELPTEGGFWVVFETGDITEWTNTFDSPLRRDFLLRGRCHATEEAARAHGDALRKGRAE